MLSKPSKSAALQRLLDAAPRKYSIYGLQRTLEYGESTSDSISTRLETPFSNLLKLDDLTPGQQDLINLLVRGGHKLIIWTGSVRQGKTAGADMGMIGQSLRDHYYGIGNGIYILGGPTITSVVRNQRAYYQDICYQMGVHFKHVSGKDNYFEVGNAIFYIFGGDNEGAQGKLVGLTATSAHVDEVTECVQSFVEEVEYRCSFDESVVLLTSNSDVPTHWLKTDYIDEERPDCFIMESGIYENHHLSDSRREYWISQNATGTQYRQKILNQWTPRTGLVYPVLPEHIVSVDPVPNDPTQPLFGFVSIDVGTAGVMAALFWVRLEDGRWLIIDEHEHYGRRDGIITEEAFIDIIAAKWSFVEIVYDPSGVMFGVRAQAKGYRAIPANNDVIPGTQAVNNALYNGVLLIHSRCSILLGQCAGYSWNELTGKPIKKNDHFPDAKRYGCMHVMPPQYARITHR